jgi:hypothetical protein
MSVKAWKSFGRERRVKTPLKSDYSAQAVINSVSKWTEAAFCNRLHLQNTASAGTMSEVMGVWLY